MGFSIVKGVPTPEELVAIEHAMSLHRREELTPVIARSSFGSPQLRKPFNTNFQFGTRKN